MRKVLVGIAGFGLILAAALGLVLVTVVGAVLLAGPAHAAGTAGLYAGWSKSGSSGAFTGTGVIAAAGFPGAAVASNATTVQVPSGASAFLGPDTPIGAKYGSSQNQSYLNVTTANSFAPSVTTLSFDQPTPAGNWAFALGDVDADTVMITALDADGSPVDPADLGYVSSFNYCAASPKPSSCVGGGSFTDAPVWHPMSARLVGNGVDTTGASAWFEPTVALSKITFTFSRQSGSPVFQLWTATLAVPVSTVVDGITPGGPKDSVALDLKHEDGTPVLDGSGSPVSATPDDQGQAEFPAVVDGTYIIKIVPGKDAKVTGADSVKITVDVTKGPVTVPAGTFSVVIAPASLTSLPVTGAGHAVVPLTGGGLIAAGAGLLFLVRRRR